MAIHQGLSAFSIGLGDRFAHQAANQLRACQMAAQRGVDITPVWNKSNREHLIIGSEPADVRAAAAKAVQNLGWTRPWFVDADHIRLDTVDRFLGPSDFFTIDVAESIGKPAEADAVAQFVDRHPELVGKVAVAGVSQPLVATAKDIRRIAAKYLLATHEAGRIHRHIAAAKGAEAFVAEVSMDETDLPQAPAELLVILAALADEGVPLQTIAPKFTGRFNKGVDYVGDLEQFEREFNDDIGVIAHAVKTYGLPANLKLSIHSGSDKFSIYPAVRRALSRHNAGVHLKTAGTTWLEECIGLAEAGGEGLRLAKEIYAEALAHIDELCVPYATVIDIDRSKLPTAATANDWTAEQFVGALRHDQRNPAFNPHLRQLLHVGFKVAARLGRRYLEQLRACEASIARNVTTNLFERHIRPLFL
jgi:tagaturonate epimerase